MRPSTATSLGTAPGLRSVGLWFEDGQARRYDSDGNHEFYTGLLARLLEGVSPDLQGRGLDLGCGSGFATEGLVRALPRVAWHGLDVSASMLARASGKPELARVRFVHAAAEALPYAAATFDVVVSNFSWHWFAPTAAAEVARILRPGGWLLVCAPLRHLSQAGGNRWLARRLLARRHSFHRLGSQGLRLAELPRLLPVPLHTERLREAIVEERFPDARALLSTLQSRGALQAIFGANQADLDLDLPAGPMAFEWPIGLLHARTVG
jgi:SAM-dependent methyltransferase